MKIESIKPGKRDREKLVIKTECGKYISAYVDDAYMLSVGDELSDEEAARIERRYAEYFARKSAARSLAKRNMSHSELSKKLRGRGFSEEESEKAVDWFEERGLIDDGAYAKSIVSYYVGRGYGVMRIRQELSRRGIDRETVDEALIALGSNDGAIASLIEKKLQGKVPDADEKRKLYAYLARRGFRHDEIRAAMADMKFDTEDME